MHGQQRPSRARLCPAKRQTLCYPLVLPMCNYLPAACTEQRCTTLIRHFPSIPISTCIPSGPAQHVRPAAGGGARPRRAAGGGRGRLAAPGGRGGGGADGGRGRRR